MSGSGRKSQYRKSVTTTFLNDNRIPEGNEKIVIVLGNRGDNTFEIELEEGEKALARLPKKFNKLIWIKTGDYIIIEDDQVGGSETSSTLDISLAGKAQYTITHILSKPNCKYLKSGGLWPARFDLVEASVCSSSNVMRNDDLMPSYEERDMEDGEDELYENEEGDVQFDSRGNTIEK